MAAIGKGLMYYILMCANTTAILWVLNDILRLFMFTKEQRDKMKKEDDEELHNDPTYRAFMSMLGFKTDDQLAIFVFILATFIPGLNVMFWKGLITCPFEDKKRI